MLRVMVKYTVKADRVEENERLVRAVFAGLKEIGDPGIRYATFKLEDGQTFVHMALYDSQEKQDIVSGSPAFAEFQKDLGDRCEVPLDVQVLTPVGAYNFPGAD